MSQQIPVKTLFALMIGCVVAVLVSELASKVLHMDVTYMQAGMAFAGLVSLVAIKHNASVVMSSILGIAMLAFVLGSWAMFALGAILFVVGRMLATKISEATFAAGMFCLVIVGLSIFNSLQTAVMASR